MRSFPASEQGRQSSSRGRRYSSVDDVPTRTSSADATAARPSPLIASAGEIDAAVSRSPSRGEVEVDLLALVCRGCQPSLAGGTQCGMRRYIEGSRGSTWRLPPGASVPAGRIRYASASSEVTVDASRSRALAIRPTCRAEYVAG
jgi:hypothetical protein